MFAPIDTTSDTLDSRDIIDRIKYLERIDGLDTDEQEELKMLQDFEKEAALYCSDWKFGATLIEDSFWPQYAEELAEEQGLEVPDWLEVDWTRTAHNLMRDYTSIELDGTTYWVR